MTFELLLQEQKAFLIQNYFTCIWIFILKTKLLYFEMTRACGSWNDLVSD